MMIYTYTDTPIGAILVAGDDDAIVEICFAGARPKPEWIRDDAAFAGAASQLRAYFAGALSAFDLPLAPAGSEFQQAVWHQLVGIGYGDTASYGEIARRLGRSNAASRAVGLANGSNPIPIVIPCHRVIGADGSLTGYAGGVERKQTLLELEQDALF